MNKLFVFILISLFISGLLSFTFNHALASELVENSWTEKASMSQVRSSFGVVAVEGKIYAIGGVRSDWSYVATNERYDPAIDVWTTLKPMPTPRSHLAVAEYQGKIYCIGGVAANYDGPFVSKGLSVNEVYDIATDSWSTKASMPFTGVSQAHVIDGKIYVTSSIVSQTVLYVYDPSADSWVIKTNLPDVQKHEFSVVIDDKIMFVDTVSFPDWDRSTQKVMIYDPKTDVWSEKATPDFFVPAFGVAGATTGNYAPIGVYALGFTYSNNMALSNQFYDLKSDTWTIAKDMPIKQSATGVAVVNDILYVIDGAFTYQYIPIGYRGATPDPELSITSSPKLPNRFGYTVSLGSLFTYLLMFVLILLVSLIGASLFFRKNRQKLTKFFIPLIITLIITSLAVAFFVTQTDKQSVQNKPMTQEEHVDFMKNMLMIDVSKYNVVLANNSTLNVYPERFGERIDLRYQLISKDSDIDVSFTFENGTMTMCGVFPLRGQVITNKQYNSQLDAVKDFLEKYQTYTKLNSRDLIAMLNSVDATKDAIAYTENLRLVVSHNEFAGITSTHFQWTYTINNANNTPSGLSLEFDKTGTFMFMGDSRTK